MTKKPDKSLISEILKNSNWIERVYEDKALEDAQRAWKWAYSNIDNIDLKYVLKVHKLLLRRIDPMIAGKVRRTDVFIGGHRKFFISIQLLEDEIKAWCKICDIDALNGLERYQIQKKLKKWHILFEHFHVFADGNGRVGRLLMNIQAVKAGIDPLLIRGWGEHELYFHRDQENYYKWFHDRNLEYI